MRTTWHKAALIVATMAMVPLVPDAGVGAQAPTCNGLTATIVGGAGNDWLVGGPGPDVIVGGAGNDFIRGFGGNDTICGQAGDDILVGNAGNDYLEGGAGNDRIVGAKGNDTLVGGDGTDDARGKGGTDECATELRRGCDTLAGGTTELGADPRLNNGPQQPPWNPSGLTEAENLALIASNATRNTSYDDNPYRDVPMADIAVSDLTVPDDLYDEALLDTSTSGFFRVKCDISHFAYDDPIVFPNQPGRAHLHMFFGNTETNAFSTFESLLNSGTGSCNGEDLNRTGYWVPALLNADGDALIPFEVMVYYKNDNFRLNGANELVAPFPDNLRMVSGQAMANAPQTTLTGGSGSQPVVSFGCGFPYNAPTQTALIPTCDGNGNGPWNGPALEMKVTFPQCFNPTQGTYLADGSHMSYSDGGYYAPSCPASHPYDVSSIMYRIFFSPDQYGGSLDGVRLSSDVRPDQVLPAGTTLHGDWFGAWHPDAMQLWVDNCNNTQADCEIGLLDRSPALSLVPRQTGFYPPGYLARAEDLIALCPGKTLDTSEPLRSVANCRTS